MGDFTEVELSQVPAFEIFRQRLKVLRPMFTTLKAGRRDDDLYRIYVVGAGPVWIPIDLFRNKLNDLRDDPGDSRAYTAELMAYLDKSIKEAVRPDE